MSVIQMLILFDGVSHFLIFPFPFIYSFDSNFLENVLNFIFQYSYWVKIFFNHIFDFQELFIIFWIFIFLQSLILKFRDAMILLWG